MSRLDNQLKTTDAAKLLQEYRFQRETSLRSVQHSRTNMALTSFIIAFAALQMGLSYPSHRTSFYGAAAAITFGGIIFALTGLIPRKEARKLEKKNKKFVERLEGLEEDPKSDQ